MARNDKKQHKWWKFSFSCQNLMRKQWKNESQSSQMVLFSHHLGMRKWWECRSQSRWIVVGIYVIAIHKRWEIELRHKTHKKYFLIWYRCENQNSHHITSFLIMFQPFSHRKILSSDGIDSEKTHRGFETGASLQEVNLHGTSLLILAECSTNWANGRECG